jgi:hypothetical protein
MYMNTGRSPLFVALAVMFLTGIPAVLQAVTENPYGGIVDRNVFGLKPPVTTSAADAEANKLPPPKITLAGIATILGKKQALMTAQLPAKPGETPKLSTYMLVEGQQDGEIEVLAIDEKAGVVKVKNHGTVQSLNFEKDGAKLPNTPAPAVALPPGGVPGLPVPPPLATPGGIRPTSVNPAFSPTGTRTIPTRSLRLPSSSGSVDPAGTGGGMPLPSPAAYTGAAVTTPGQGTVTLPGFSQVQPGLSQSYVPPSVGSAEEQAIMIEAMRQKDPGMGAFLPPTPLNPRANLNEDQLITNPQQQNQNQGQQFPPIPGFPPGPVPTQ